MATGNSGDSFWHRPTGNGEQGCAASMPPAEVEASFPLTDYISRHKF